ncbi:hypothetical protein HY440_03055 [Candidatus Microgenomates bacterium]|nr:hypothetical protein [Candidatus Microgenomates bacterium]
MKNIIVIIVIIVITLIGHPAFAADSTPSAKAQDLLDRVATKVAQLSAQLQKAYAGQIKSLGDTTIVITTESAERAIHTSDATSFFRVRANNRSEVNFAALKIGDDIAAIGTIDPATSDLTARQIIAKIARTNLTGTIKAIDKTIVTLPDDTKVDLDGASLKLLTANRKIITAKLADFKVGATIFVIAHSPDQNSGIYASLKALTIAQ